MVVALAIGAIGCGKKTEQAPAPAPAAAVTVTDVDLGNAIGGDKHVTAKANSFSPNDVIYAVVMTSGTSPSASLKARWTYEDGQVVEESEQAITPTGDTATEFHISKPDGFPKGKYKVEVLLNGSSVQSKDFEVK
jgi:hypothetical protein